MAQEFLFSELDKYFEPKSHISPDGLKSKWRAVPYRTGDICGTMLSSLPEGTPEDICFDPQLTGWHKIYIAVPAFHNLELNIKLSQDKGFFKVGPSVATSINCTHGWTDFHRLKILYGSPKPQAQHAGMAPVCSHDGRRSGSAAGRADLQRP